MLYGFEVESVDDLLHQGFDVVVAEVSDTAGMGVADFFVVGKMARLDIQSYFLVSIAEGHSLSGQTVYLFDTEHVEVTVVIEDVFVHLDAVDDVGRHAQAVLQFFESGEEDLFDDL